MDQWYKNCMYDQAPDKSKCGLKCSIFQALDKHHLVENGMAKVLVRVGRPWQVEEWQLQVLHNLNTLNVSLLILVIVKHSS